jgi:hypothetical protein
MGSNNKPYVIVINPYRSAGDNIVSALRKNFTTIAIWDSNEWFLRWGFRKTECDIEYVLGQNNLDIAMLEEELNHTHVHFIYSCDDHGSSLMIRLLKSVGSKTQTPLNIESTHKDYIQSFLSTRVIGSEYVFPDIKHVNSVVDDKEYIIKPINGTGNENVTIAKGKHLELFNNSPNTDFLIQDFYEGREFCVETTMLGGHPICSTVSEYVNPYRTSFGSPWRTANLLMSPIDVNPKLIEFAQRITLELGVKTGVTWIQIKQTGDGQLVFIECNLRSQGHPHNRCLKQATSLVYSTCLADYLLYGKIPQQQVYEKLAEFSKHSINNFLPNHTIESINIPECESIVAKSVNIFNIPGTLNETSSFLTNAGILFIVNRDPTAFVNDYRKIELWEQMTFGAPNYVDNIFRK